MSSRTNQEVDSNNELRKVQLGPKTRTVPVSWDIVQLEDISEVKRGASPRPIGDSKYFGGDVGWVRISDISNTGKYLTETEEYLSNEGVNESVRVYPGQVLLSISASVGKPVILDIDACIHDGLVAFRNLVESIDRGYLYYALIDLKPRLLAKGQTGTQSNVNSTLVKRSKIPLPPLHEQHRIADILSTVDESIKQTNDIIEKATEIRKGVLNDLLTKGINKSQLEDVQFGPIERTIPTSWDVVELKDITEKLTNGISESQNTEGNGFPVTRIETIANGKVNLAKVGWVDDDPSEYKDYRIRENDILFSHINSLDHVGKAAQYRDKETTLYHGMNLLLLRFDWDLIHPRFAYICITAPYFRKLCRSFAKKAVNQVSLNQSDVGSLPLLLPGYNEQEMIARRVECIDQKIRIERQQKQYLKDLKRGLMQDLLTGKVRVNTD